LPEPRGEDAPMTARLERILTGRLAGRSLAPVDEKLNTARATPPPHLVAESSQRSLARAPSGAVASPRSGNTPRGISKQPSAVGSTVGFGAASAARTGEPQGLVVRTGGFQWIERQQAQNQPTLTEDASNISLLRTPQAPLLLQETPPRSRSSKAAAA